MAILTRVRWTLSVVSLHVFWSLFLLLTIAYSVNLSIYWLYYLFFRCLIFYYSVDYIFILVVVSFAVQNLLNLMQSHLSFLAIISWAIWVLFRKLLPMLIFSSVFPEHFQSFRSCIKVFKPLWVDFCMGLEYSSFCLLHVEIQFWLHHLLRGCLFSNVCF
jgi:hypothetical protein